MIGSELSALILYITSMFVLRSYFDLTFITSGAFWWKTLVITAASCFPVYLVEWLARKLSPPSYTKVTD